MALNLKHQTPAQFAARLRQRYLTSSKEETAKIATWLLGKIEDGSFTDLQVRNAFGLTALQWTTLKNKMIALRTNYQAILASVGE